MNILIVGGGTVGTAICTELAAEGHNITIVDKDMACLKEISNTCDVVGVMGNGAEVSTLREAGAGKTDLLIAVTSMDEVNIICCTAAKKMGAKHTIARVRNPEYAELMQMLKNDMNLSLTINPELQAAKEISRILRFPSANKVDTLARGRVELAEFVVESNSPLCDTSLFELRSKLNMKFLVCAVKRDGKAYIPSGNFVIKEGDTVCFTASDEEIAKVFKAVGSKRPIKNVLIAGAGRITYYLQPMLKKSKIACTVIDSDKRKCKEIAEDFDCSVICNDTTKQEVLKSQFRGDRYVPRRPQKLYGTNNFRSGNTALRGYGQSKVRDCSAQWRDSLPQTDGLGYFCVSSNAPRYARKTARIPLPSTRPPWKSGARADT